MRLSWEMVPVISWDLKVCLFANEPPLPRFGGNGEPGTGKCLLEKVVCTVCSREFKRYSAASRIQERF